MPRVSILLPCHDAAATLADTIASLDAQTFRDCEIIAVDDGSTDDTRVLLDAWRARDARVRVLARDHHGIAAALAAGAAAADGEIIARMDADDVAHPRRIEMQVALLDADPATGACGTLVRYFPRSVVQNGARRYERWINTLVDHDDIVRDIFVECPLAHPTLVLRRAALERAGGYLDHGWPEDYDLVLRLWQQGVILRKVPEVLLHWRERPDRASRTSARYADDAFRRCKVHYLKRTLLRNRDGVVVWGAGPVGKAFARELLAQGKTVRAFVDLDPRKIGQIVHGAPVIAPRQIGRYRSALALAAVGSAAARAEIRAALRQAGWTEGSEFVAVA